MILRETGAIAVSALPVRALSSHLRLGHGFADDGAEDALLERLLREAVSVVEQRLGQALIRRAFELEVSGWDRNGHLVLPTGPVEALQSLELMLDGTVTPVAPSAWRLEPGRSRQKVTGPLGGCLPDLTGERTGRAVFEAGYGPVWSDVPEDIAHAAMRLAAYGYENRDGEGSDGTPAGVLALLDLRRPVRL